MVNRTHGIPKKGNALSSALQVRMGIITLKNKFPYRHLQMEEDCVLRYVHVHYIHVAVYSYVITYLYPVTITIYIVKILPLLWRLIFLHVSLLANGYK